VTLTISDLINMFKKAKILDTDRISISDFIEIVEKYHAIGSGLKLQEKLSDASFKAYIKANQMTLAVNRDLAVLKEYFAKIEEAKRLGENPTVTKEMLSED